MVEYESVYADYLTQFIAFKRGLGYKYIGAESRFRRFDRFAAKEGCTVVGITKEMFEKWMEPVPNEAESNRYRRVNELINFSKFLNAFGIVSFCPRNIPHKPTGFVPYIFTHEEITRFFTACDENMAYTRPAGEFTYATPALYRLLYGTGLRIGEALSLKSEDVHLEEEYLLIRNTKNNTERLVPFSASVTNALRQYDAYKRRIFGAHTKYFFASAGDNSWSKNNAYDYFRKILARAQISHTEKGPRLHDFRHTFSVHTLAEMSEQGLDLYCSLPILSKYLGHESLEATDRYVRLTEEMYPELLQQANQLCSYIFPEVNQDGI